MQDVRLTVSEYPAQGDDPVWETTVGETLRRAAAEDPTAPALVEVTVEGAFGRRWSYGELLRDAERLALALSTRYAPGERVCVWAHNIPEWILMEYAAALSGLTLVTANPAFQPQELRYVLEQSRAVGLFRVAGFRGNPMAEIAAEATAGFDAIREVVDLNDDSALYAEGARPAALPEVRPDDPAQIQYTSGTTGFPKGAILSHKGLVNNARFYANRCGTTKASTWLNVMPLFHTAGCSMVALGSLQAACKMVLAAQFDPAVVNRVIEAERANFLVCVPTMAIAMRDALDQEPRDVSSLQMMSAGGSQVAPEVIRSVGDAFGCAVAVIYGQTEYCPVICKQFPDETLADAAETVGRPLDHTAVSIRPVGETAPASLGEVGEICVRGPYVMLGYNDNPAATAEAIDPDGWLHTGDLGTMDDRGYVRITGRVKDMIIRGGENHFPAEIENMLLEHPDIAEVAVIGLPDAKWGEIIAAFYRSVGRSDLDEGDLRRHCRERLSPQKTPTVWRRVTAFPMTGSGKIQKFALRNRYAAGDYSR